MIFSSANVSVLLNTHASPAPPVIVSTINPVANTITLSWALSAAGYTLETITDLGSANWQSASGIQSTNNGNVTVTVSIGQGSHFFRLTSP